MSYIVLARKWRPQTFSDLTGQEHVSRTLTNAIQLERVPHAMLFTGARGVGKTTSARIISMALNCAKGPTPSPCGLCPSCTEVQRGASVDVVEIDGASNRGINEIRELRDGVRYAPQRDRYKIYIIDEVHMLTTEAFNALLKTLEEPPAHVVFIFATTEVHKIPVTILSRCQRFDFRRISHADIIARLTHIVNAEGMAIPGEVLHLIARQAQGGMRDALSLLDQVIAFAGPSAGLAAVADLLGASERSRLFEVSRAILQRRVDDALGAIDAVASYGTDLAHFTEQLIQHFRDLAVVSVSRAPERLTNLSDAEIGEARRQVESVPADLLQRMFEELVQSADAIARSLYPKLLLEMCIVRLCAMEAVLGIDGVIAHLEALAAGQRPTMPIPGALPAAPRGQNRASGGSAPPTVAAEPVFTAPAAAAPSASATVAAHAPSPATTFVEHPVSAAVAPEPARNEASSAVAEPVAASQAPPPAQSPARAAARGVSREATTDDWRQIVGTLRKAVPRIGSLLASATFLPASAGALRIALPAAFHRRFSADDRVQVVSACQATLGAAPALTLEVEESVDAAELEQGLVISALENAAAEAKRTEARRGIQEHESIRTAMALWPGARVDVRVRDLSEDEGT